MDILVAGFAITARMWSVCDNPDCAEEDDPTVTQPMEWLPIELSMWRVKFGEN
jgi:hypothetical protein